MNSGYLGLRKNFLVIFLAQIAAIYGNTAQRKCDLDLFIHDRNISLEGFESDTHSF